MAVRNPNFSKLSQMYLFPEINRRKKLFLEKHPQASLISLGIGDTTEPLPRIIAEAMRKASSDLASREHYSGYGPEQGYESLRRKIADIIYHNKISPDDIFISDGAKCDIGRLQLLFGPDAAIAMQDPVYPVYLDGSLLQGVRNIVFLPCKPENDFWPDLIQAKRADVIYWCSPNNPTGAVSTKSQLEQLVAFARENRSIIAFDVAYAQYIQDQSLPFSIYDIAGAEEVAIELGSFSKLAGFSGVRLGWSVVPEKLKYDNGMSIKNDWKRVTSTIFNGASLIAQKGGEAVLTPKGFQQVKEQVKFYLENASLLREALLQRGYETYGGMNAPYLWVKFSGKASWNVFQEFLEKAYLITTPGVGFGKEGEGFLRLSAFGKRETILEAIDRLKSIRPGI